MPRNTLSKKLVGVDNIVIENEEYDELSDSIIITARPYRKDTCRCGKCGRKASVYDYCTKERSWRCLDAGNTKVFVRTNTYRVDCPECGVVVAGVPWANHNSGFSADFEQACCWLSVNASKTVVSELLRIDWHSVGDICDRVYKRLEGKAPDPCANLKRIGIDETSYKKGHKYLTVVVDHDTASVVWCAKGHGKAVLESFFSQLSVEQRNAIECVSADGARYISSAIEEFCPNATRCVDPFHVVSWATEALDEVRKQEWRRAHAKAKTAPKRGRGRPRKDEEVNPERKAAKSVKGARYPILKNPEDLSAAQQATLDIIRKENCQLWRAYRLKEGLREIFRLPKEKVAAQLDSWISWAQRSRIPEFVELQRKIKRHYDAIIATTKHGLSNARVEAINNKIKLSVRMAYGFRNVDNLLAMVMLRCSAIKIGLPGR